MTIQPGIGAADANRTTLQEVRVADLKTLADEPRLYSKRESELARDALKRWPNGAPLPIIINGELEILDGLEFEPPKLAYSIREACRASSLGRSTVYSHISAGRLRAVRVGGRTLIPAESLLALIAGEA